MRKSIERVELVDDFVKRVFSGSLHAKRILSLANGTLGVLTGASLAVSVIGHALAQASGLLDRHASSYDNTIRLWDVAAGAEPWTTRSGCGMWRPGPSPGQHDPAVGCGGRGRDGKSPRRAARPAAGTGRRPRRNAPRGAPSRPRPPHPTAGSCCQKSRPRRAARPAAGTGRRPRRNAPRGAPSRPPAALDSAEAE